MPWELDERLKCGIHEANMNLIDSQHRDWFIAALLPHLSISLSQKKIGTQVETQDIMIRLQRHLFRTRLWESNRFTHNCRTLFGIAELEIGKRGQDRGARRSLVP